MHPNEPGLAPLRLLLPHLHDRRWQGFAAAVGGWTAFWLAALCQWPAMLQNLAALLFFIGLALPGFQSMGAASHEEQSHDPYPR